MKRYDKYKSSGVEWIGKIPEHWKTSRLKFLLLQNDGGVWGGDANGLEENATKVFRSTEINVDGSWNFDDEPELRILSEQEKAKTLLREGDLLVTKSSGSQLHIGKTALVTHEIERQECCYSNFVQRLRPLHTESSKYLHIFLNSKLAREQYNFLSNSTTGLANLSAELISDVIVPTPELKEQIAIAKYLGEKIEQINGLIENKRRLIELLKEEQKEIINQAITRGINPNVTFKPSGIEWLGDVPEHWEVKKLKYVANLKSGESITSDAIRDEGQYPVFGGNGQRGYFSSFTHEGNYVLIGRQGALCGNINYASDKFWASEHAIVATLLDAQELIWFGELLRAMNLNQYSQSAAQPGLSVEKIKNLSIPVPPFSEQKQIVQVLETKRKEIEKTISKIEREIELLQEYRTALISEVVTGKIKVI